MDEVGFRTARSMWDFASSRWRRTSSTAISVPTTIYCRVRVLSSHPPDWNPACLALMPPCVQRYASGAKSAIESDAGARISSSEIPVPVIAFR